MCAHVRPPRLCVRAPSAVHNTYAGRTLRIDDSSILTKLTSSLPRDAMAARRPRKIVFQSSSAVGDETLSAGHTRRRLVEPVENLRRRYTTTSTTRLRTLDRYDVLGCSTRPRREHFTGYQRKWGTRSRFIIGLPLPSR